MSKLRKLFKLKYFLIIVGISLICSLFLIDISLNNNIEKILQSSDLKNKKFSVKIEDILENGVNAFLMEEHSNKIVSISFLFKNSGYAHDTEGQFGLSKLTSQVLLSGTAQYSEDEFQDILEANAINLTFGVSADDFYGTLIFPKDNIDVAIDLFKEAFYFPTIESKYLDIAKQKMITNLKVQTERPDSLLDKVFLEQLYNNHPYSRNPLGKEEDILSITRGDIHRYLADMLGKDNLVVGIAGDINRKEAENVLNEMFGRLPKETLSDELPEFVFSSEGKEYKMYRDIPQKITLFASEGVKRESPEFYPLYIANYILGEAGLSSKLSKVLREDNSLTYGIYTYLSNMNFSNLIKGKFSSTTENFDKAMDLLKQQWNGFVINGISEEELAESKQSLVNSFYLRFSSVSQLSSMLVGMQKYNLGIDFLDKRNEYIANVSLEDVNKVIKKYFTNIPDFVMIGNFDKE